MEVTFPEEYGDERYAGKAAVFKTELLGISTQELPEIDDELAKDISEFDTIAELRADIEKKLKESAEQSAQTQFENAVFDTIVAGTDAIIPQVLYDRRIDQRIREFENQLQQQYGDLKIEEYLQLTGMTMEQLRDEYEPQAKKEVTLRLALEKIADTEDIQVTDEELDEALTQFAAELNAPVEFVKSRIPVEDYRTDMRVQKAVELIKNNAVVDNEAAKEEAAEAPAEEAKADEEAKDAE